MYGSCFLAIDRRLAQLPRLAAAVVVAAAAAAAAAAAVVADAATLIAHSIHSTETGQPAQPGGPPSYPNMSVDRLYYSHKGELRSRKEEHTATLGLLYYSSLWQDLLKLYSEEVTNIWRNHFLIREVS